MKNGKLSVGITFFICLIAANSTLYAQQVRERIVVRNQPSATQTTPEREEKLEPLIVGEPQKTSPRSLAAVPASPKVSPSRPILTDEIRVVAPKVEPKKVLPPKVETTQDDQNIIPLSDFEQKLFQAMQAKLGINYRYGSDGPNSFDCSGLIWRVYREAGYDFGRASAASYWNQFQPVGGDDRYKFGTLVFFNRLGHVGIVVDENGFYHASSSKGVTYSPFRGYWGKRIVGFRRIPLNN